MLELPRPKRVVSRPLATVSASFNRNLREVRLAVEELFDEGAAVLSPKRPMPYRELNKGFLLLDGDRSYADLSVRSVEDRHLACIAQSDFLWLVCPDGYVGNAAAFEIGTAIGQELPIYALHVPLELRIAAYVTVVPSAKYAVMNHRIANL